MARYFSADWHLGARNFCHFAHRPFPSQEFHDKYVIHKTNEKVGRDDELIIVGDFCEVDPRPYLEKIICDYVTLVFGNHDVEEYNHVYYRCIEQGYIELSNGKRVFVNHYPVAYWRGSHNGVPHLYGHVHDLREDTLDRAFPGRRSADCGLDTARRLLGDYVPFHEDEIIPMLMEKPGHDGLEFYNAQDEIRKHWIVENGEIVPRPKCVSPVLHRPPTVAEFNRKTCSRAAA
jgi:calcineurin-like phosphoesterase family protein